MLEELHPRELVFYSYHFFFIFILFVKNEIFAVFVLCKMPIVFDPKFIVIERLILFGSQQKEKVCTFRHEALIMGRIRYVDITKDKYNKVNINNSFISNCFHKVVKHCIEATFIGEKYFHVGFANNNVNRTFVSYLRLGVTSQTPRFYNIDGNNYKGCPANISIEENENVLICLDSENSIITAIKGEQQEYYRYEIVKDMKTWYVLGSGNTEYFANIKINYGFKTFTNKMPDGYSSWIIGIDRMINLYTDQFTVMNNVWLVLFYCFILYE